MHRDVASRLNGIFVNGKIKYWGSIPGLSNNRNFKLLKEGDELLCYRSGKYIALCEIAFTSINSELSKYSWGETETGKTWELIYFFKDILYFQIESSLINNEFGFKNSPVMGFNTINSDKTKVFLSKHGSVKSFINKMGYENKIINTTLEQINKTKILTPFEAQYYLVDLGNQLEYDTYVPTSDAGHSAFGKKLDEMITIRKTDLSQYVAPAIINPLSNIDVIWFKNNYQPRYFYEVIHRSGMNEAFARLKAVSNHYETAKTRIIGEKDNVTEFEKSRRLYFPDSSKISYKNYDDLIKIHTESAYYNDIVDEFII